MESALEKVALATGETMNQTEYPKQMPGIETIAICRCGAEFSNPQRESYPAWRTEHEAHGGVKILHITPLHVLGSYRDREKETP